MTQYIDKDALLAEIKRLHKAHSGRYGCDEVGLNLEYLEDFINTLEVKEVDFEREIDGELKTRWMGEYLNMEKFYESAKHFFELGLKAQKGE